MNPLWIAKVLEIWESIKKYWREIGCGLFVLLTVTQIQSCRKIGAIKDQLEICQEWSSSVSKSNLELQTALKSKASASARVVVRTVQGEPGQTIFVPCPEVTVEANSTGEGEAAQTVTNTATSTPPMKPECPTMGVFIGGGWYDGPEVLAGLEYRRLAIQAQASNNGKVGGALSWKAFVW